MVGAKKERKAMRPFHYKHKQKNFKPKVKTGCILFERVLLEILELIKEQEGISRSVIIERMIIYFLEKEEKGNKDETAWNKSKRSYRRTLKNYKKEDNAKRKQLQKAKKDEKKKALYIYKSSPFSYFRGY